ncbi:MAG: transporter substrate-binding domain-containing protein [Pseudomonadota bacterium]
MAYTKAAAALALAVSLLASGPARASDPCADYIPQPKPQNASRDIVGQELDQIIEQGHMLFAVYEDYPPYSWEEGGKPMGIDVDIARLIAEDLGVDARFNFVAAGENLQADLRFNIWRGPLIGGRISNVMMRVPWDPKFACRVEQVVFTGQYGAEAIAIAYSEEAYPEEKPVPAYFRFDTVGVENDSIADFYLSNFAGGQLAPNINRFSTMDEAMEALASGEVMAVMGPRSQIDHGLGEGLGVHEPPLAGFSISEWTVGLGVNFRYRPLAYSVDDAVRYALDDGRIQAIHEKYGVTFRTPER